MTYLIFSTICLIVSVTVGVTIIRVRFDGFLSSSTLSLSPSAVTFFRFAAINWRYPRLCRGPLGLGWFNGGAANHKTSLVSGSRSNNLATHMKCISIPMVPKKGKLNGSREIEAYLFLEKSSQYGPR